MRPFAFSRIAVFLFYGAASVVILTAPGCSSSKSARDSSNSQSAAWQQRPLLIDGIDDDWDTQLPYYDKKERLNYAISNDRENVYIRLAVKDAQEQQKIMSGGMTLWINSQADKNTSSAVGVGFPVDNSRNDRDRQLMEQAQPGRYKQPDPRDNLKSYSLYGFPKQDGPVTYDAGQTNDAGVEVKINFNRSGVLIYEALVPFNSIFPQNTAHNFSGKSIAIGFLVEGIPPNVAAMRDRDGGGGGVSVGGGVGMGSFGGGGGLGLSIGTGSLARIGGRSKKQQYDPSETWQVVELARPAR